ncbi:MAG: hypothetical protein K8R48_00225 [Alphaproteobacteria bacterium]|nr:hypothetical protein [Alphaproteobacteria bacterium]
MGGHLFSAVILSAAKDLDWRGKKGELVFDSLETLGDRVKPKQWEKLAMAFAKALGKDPGNVTALHIGAGGETPESLCKAFNQASAKPIDYNGYRDSREQVAVWSGRPSRWAWLMNR